MSFYVLLVIIIFLFYGSYLLFRPPTEFERRCEEAERRKTEEAFVRAVCEGLDSTIIRCATRDYLAGRIDGWEYADTVREARIPAAGLEWGPRAIPDRDLASQLRLLKKTKNADFEQEKLRRRMEREWNEPRASVSSMVMHENGFYYEERHDS